MPIVAEQYRFVTGVDTHARRHSLAIIEAGSGRQIDGADFPATVAGYARAGSWLVRRAGDPSAVLVSMEGTGSYGAKLREHLTRCEFRVVEAPSPGRAPRRRHGKSDQLDALRAAQAVLSLPTDRLTEAKAGEVITALRVLSVPPSTPYRALEQDVSSPNTLAGGSAHGAVARILEALSRATGDAMAPCPFPESEPSP